MNVPALTAARAANRGTAAATAPPLRHGAYLCFRLPADSRAAAAAAVRRRGDRARGVGPRLWSDFLNYFESADAHVARFDGVCAALRDRARNPEWAFVREGPTWRGRRVRTWQELLA